MSQAVPLRNSRWRGGRRSRLPAIDYGLVIAVTVLLGLGLVMVASASLHLGDRNLGEPFYYVLRHIVALLIGLSLAGLITRVPMTYWERSGTALFFFGLLILAMVFVPGLGKTVNGSTRWIPLGPASIQSSELMKFFAVIYIAGYLVRRQQEVSRSFWGFAKPMILLVVACSLIIAQPDFGTTAVLLATALGMLFLGGVPIWQFGLLLGLAGSALAGLVVWSPYRLQRITTFIDPWDDPFGSGFQLTQALIAFGRGEWWGVGLGNGIQKQFYLPEAHTDFLMAVIGEELGLIGTLAVIALFAYITWRAFRIGERAENLKQKFSAFTAFGFGLWIGLQAFINIGVNVGLLPTKGLTLPLMSYGSNSLVVACAVIAVLLRIDLETREIEQREGVKERRWRRG